MHEFLLERGRSNPGGPAVVEFSQGGEPVVTSYRQLEDRMGEYAAVLDGLGLDVGDRVVLETDTSGPAIALFLACSSLGLVFVPVSPEVPDARLASIVESARPALHLQADAGTRTGLPEGVGTGRFGPGGLGIERPPAPRVRRRRAVQSTDTAYMIFTSGTTGRPKGVVMSHRGVIAFYRSLLAAAAVAPDSRVATTSPFQFDFSLLDIGLAFGSGAAVVPVPRAVLTWPRRFLRFLEESGATHVDGVPSVWRPVLAHEAETLGRLTGLRGILYSGEVFPPAELRRLQELQPRLRIVNCFGSTESIACSFTDVPNPLPASVEELPIACAGSGAEIVLVDEDGGIVTEPGRAGEIHLYSPALFTGYWDAPRATRAALVPDPVTPQSGQVVFRSGDLGSWDENGRLFYRGRSDSLVKIRGNRVELGEVERRLLEHPAVRASAVLALPQGRTGRELALHAFVVPHSAGDFEERALRSFLKEALPEYMVPHQVTVLGSLPVTTNGKTDRAALGRTVAGARPQAA
ncbi:MULTISPECIES: AMP-binding protein [Streptomyces]|uniref:AMP-binding protein n=1 Tax=Streptomyces lienomycini TaxID=284035 RepID=A0ABV9X6N5_9ACTN|nr:AMP-binding protein [Streptomyces sp. NBC_00334]